MPPARDRPQQLLQRRRPQCRCLNAKSTNTPAPSPPASCDRPIASAPTAAQQPPSRKRSATTAGNTTTGKPQEQERSPTQPRYVPAEREPTLYPAKPAAETGGSNPELGIDRYNATAEHCPIQPLPTATQTSKAPSRETFSDRSATCPALGTAPRSSKPNPATLPDPHPQPPAATAPPR